MGGCVLPLVTFQYCMEVRDSATGLVDRGGGHPFSLRGLECLLQLGLPGKVYARVLERRIVKPRIQEEQCGFCPVMEHWTSYLPSHG